MQKKDWFAILYVSLAIFLWGSIGSLIDYPLLQANIYSAGSLGQFLTFFITGAIISILTIQLSKRFRLPNE